MTNACIDHEPVVRPLTNRGAGWPIAEEPATGKNERSDIAAFPELFAGMEQFIDECADGLRRTGFRLAVVVIPGSGLLWLALSRMA